MGLHTHTRARAHTPHTGHHGVKPAVQAPKEQMDAWPATHMCQHLMQYRTLLPLHDGAHAMWLTARMCACLSVWTSPFVPCRTTSLQQTAPLPR